MTMYDDPDEMYDKGVLLLNMGDADDQKRAAELLLKASEMGHLPSKRVIGFLYLEGKGVKRDLKKAYELVSEAAAALDPLAMYVLGQMYERGQGVEPDEHEALLMYAFAATMGNPLAEEDADRLEAKLAEKRRVKLRSRPILNLEVSDIDVEAVCCMQMFDHVTSGRIGVIETYKGPELVREDEDGVEVICGECPFCGKKVKKVSKNKIY